jgi:transcriptional regulator with XRE-family HTH domain
MLSQQEVADRAGTSLFTIQRIERGEGNVRPKTGRAVAAALGVSIEELLPKGEAPPWLEPSFNDAIRERRFFKFADVFEAAADKWTARVSQSTTEDAELSGLIRAVVDLYHFISENVTRREWEALTTEEQDELRRVMDKLARITADGYLRLMNSGYLDEQEDAMRRKMMREWTRRISA